MSWDDDLHMEAPFYGRDPVDVAKELDARLSFGFSHSWVGCSCGHHLLVHSAQGCHGERDVPDSWGGSMTVDCRCGEFVYRPIGGDR